MNDLQMFVIRYPGVRIMRYDFYMISFLAPSPPKEAMLIISCHDSRQRVSDVIVHHRFGLHAWCTVLMISNCYFCFVASMP